MKCCKCKNEKDISEFSYKNKKRNILQSQCKKCFYVSSILWAVKNKTKRKEAWRKWQWKQYNLSPEQYFILYEKQKGVCAICNNPETIKNKDGELCLLSVDHNHITGKVRGLLCRECNTGIGKFKDTVELLEKAVNYIKGAGQQ